MKKFIVLVLLLETTATLQAQSFSELQNYYSDSLYFTAIDAGVVVSSNVVYGTEYDTVYSIGTDGSNYTVLQHLFGGTNGYGGGTDLILSGDTLYGEATWGGANGFGSVFSIKTDGSDYSVLYNFSFLSANGFEPYGGLALSGGVLYGTTSLGGDMSDDSTGYGTVFSIHTDGTGFTTLHAFPADVSEGCRPQSKPVVFGGKLYGTTASFISADIHGTPPTTANDGSHGTVFSMDLDGGNFSLLHTFTGGLDGNWPVAGVTLVGNTLYGTTAGGDVSYDSDYNPTYYYGTLYKVNTDGSGYNVVHNFDATLSNRSNDHDGFYLMEGGLLADHDILYGMTETGGANGTGTIYSINTNGTDFNVLYSIGTACTDAGAAPEAGLYLSDDHVLYGTTSGDWDGTASLFGIQLPYIVEIDSSPAADFTFKSGVTYYINGTIYIPGTATFEGGTVIKYASGASISMDGAVNCHTTSDHPAVFTSQDDDSVGCVLPGSTHTPSDCYAYCPIVVQGYTTVQLHDIHVSYAGTAVSICSAMGNTLQNVQIQHCDFGIYIEQDEDFAFNNILMNDVGEGFQFQESWGQINYATVDHAGVLLEYGGNGEAVYITNSIFSNVTNAAPDYGYSQIPCGSYNGFYNCTEFGGNTVTNTSYPFKSGGDNNYYLADNTFRNTGYYNYDAYFLPQIWLMTTFSPLDGGYADGDQPDFGYHYLVNEPVPGQWGIWADCGY